MSEAGTAPPIAVFGLSWEFAGKRVLDEVSFELEKGSVLALIGPNGSGKSTLLKLISGVLSPRRLYAGSGVVRYRGIDFRELSPLARARQVAYVGVDLGSEFPLTAYEAVTLGRSAQGTAFFRMTTTADAEVIRAAMTQCRCWELRDRILHSLSGGERQLVSLARALAQGAGVLLLDEALSRMDLHHQEAIGALLREEGRRRGLSAILVSHDLRLALAWADTALLLKAGRRKSCGPTAGAASAENLADLYPGLRVEVLNGVSGVGAQVRFL